MTNISGHNHENGSDAANDAEHKVVRFASRRPKNSAGPFRGIGEPAFNLPPVVQRLCLSLLFVHIVLFFLPEETATWIVLHYAVIPARYVGALPFGWTALLAPAAHMFIHVGWLHLGINVATLMAFGSGVERVLGGKRLLILFFGSGVAGALTHFLFFPHDMTPMVGASGGISGLFGAVLMMAHDRGMMGQAKGLRGVLPFILLWIGVSLFFGFMGMPGENSPIAWTTHIGGFIAGLLAYKPLLRRKNFF